MKKWILLAVISLLPATYELSGSNYVETAWEEYEAEAEAKAACISKAERKKAFGRVADAFCKNGKFHREDGPAIEYTDGTKVWIVNDITHREIGDIDGWFSINDITHREGGPAIVWANGTKQWYLNGKLHREDGPAIERADGDKSWYINGHELTREQHRKVTQ